MVILGWRFTKQVLVATVASVALVACGDDDVTSFTEARNYDITITNLTSGQPLSPGIIVTHSPQVEVFRLGGSASEGVRRIAEDGEPASAVAALTGRDGVGQVVTIDAPIHRVGGPGSASRTFRIRAEGVATRISVVTMLVCTNDGFTGTAAAELPDDSSNIEAVAYDAGTENNNEMFTHIVDACQEIGPVSAPPDGNLRSETTAAIANHPGVAAAGNLTSAHAWPTPVARIEIRRVQ